MSFNILILQIVGFLDMFGQALMIPLVTSHVRTIGAGHLYVGILDAIHPACQIASGPLIGSLSDLIGQRIVLMMTLLLCGICQIIMGFNNSLFIILLVRGILGFFKQTDVLTKALVPDYEQSQEKQSKIFGKIAALSGMGITVGPFIGGLLAESYPEQVLATAAIIVAGCFVTSAGLVYMLTNTKNNDNQQQKKARTKKSITIMRRVFNLCKTSVLELYEIEWYKHGTIFSFIALMNFVILLHFSNYVYYLKTTFGLTPKSIGYIISLKGVIRSISSYMIGFIYSFYTKDKDYRTRNVHVFLVTCLSMLGILFSFNIYVYALFMIPLGISEAVAKLIFIEMVLKRGRGAHRAALIGATNSVRSISGVIAPLVSGVIGEYVGVPYVIYVGFFISVVGVCVSCKHKMIIKED